MIQLSHQIDNKGRTEIEGLQCLHGEIRRLKCVLYVTGAEMNAALILTKKTAIDQSMRYLDNKICEALFGKVLVNTAV